MGRGTIRRIVEGAQAIGQSGNGLRRCRRIFQNVTRCYPHNLPSFFVQYPIPSRVMRGPVFHIMRYPIDLDKQAYLDTREIGDIIYHRKLTSKFQSCPLAAQLTPQKHFRQRHFAP